MAIAVETLEKLQRKVTFTLSRDAVKTEMDQRLRKLSREVKMAGFRPGKVPLSVVAQRYGASVHYDVLNRQLGAAFANVAKEASLRVAGAPEITPKEGSPDADMSFDAVFEVFPEVVIPDLSALEIERIEASVDDAAVQRTIDILRKQRRSFLPRPDGSAAAEGDQVFIDFDGKIDGEPFEGGKADMYNFVLGEGQMLPEFEAAVKGMKVGESKTFPLAFPADYHGKDVAGKQADFMVTLRELHQATMPEVDAAFVESLGLADASVAGLEADVRRNLEREVKQRVRTTNRNAVMDALARHVTIDLPAASVSQEINALIENYREEMKKQGFKDADRVNLPDDAVRPQAERRVRLGLIVAELVRANQLQPTPEQIKAHIEELASSYEKPQEVVRWYYGDSARVSEVQAVVLEMNVAEHVLSRAKVTPVTRSFEQLMGRA